MASDQICDAVTTLWPGPGSGGGGIAAETSSATDDKSKSNRTGKRTRCHIATFDNFMNAPDLCLDEVVGIRVLHSESVTFERIIIES